MKNMRIEIVRNDNEPVTKDADVWASELPLAYLQGIRDAAGADPILIGHNGIEIQKCKNDIPFYTKYKTLDEALKGLKNNEY